MKVDFIFLDFAKSFDRVAHDLLLQKLCNFGISGALLNWCHDYLTNREERVVIDGVKSSSALFRQVYVRAHYWAPCVQWFLWVTCLKLLPQGTLCHYTLMTVKHQGWLTAQLIIFCFRPILITFTVGVSKIVWILTSRNVSLCESVKKGLPFSLTYISIIALWSCNILSTL